MGVGGIVIGTIFLCLAIMVIIEIKERFLQKNPLFKRVSLFICSIENSLINIFLSFLRKYYDLIRL